MHTDLSFAGRADKWRNNRQLIRTLILSHYEQQEIYNYIRESVRVKRYMTVPLSP